MALALALMASASLSASTVFQFTDTGAGINASGTLIGNDNGNGSFTITSGSGLFNGEVITLYAGSGTSPSGAFNYDNLLTPGGDPLLDTGGLLFTIAGGNELNIWGTGQGTYSTWTHDGTGYPIQNNSTLFTLTSSASAPEPGTLAMFGVGLGLAFIGGWRRRKGLAPSA